MRFSVFALLPQLASAAVIFPRFNIPEIPGLNPIAPSVGVPLSIPNLPSNFQDVANQVSLSSSCQINVGLAASLPPASCNIPGGATPTEALDILCAENCLTSLTANLNAVWNSCQDSYFPPEIAPIFASAPAIINVTFQLTCLKNPVTNTYCLLDQYEAWNLTASQSGAPFDIGTITSSAPEVIGALQNRTCDNCTILQNQVLANNSALIANLTSYNQTSHWDLSGVQTAINNCTL